MKVPRIGRLRLRRPRLPQRWRARLRAQQRWWRDRRGEPERLFPSAGKGMVSIQTLSAHTDDGTPAPPHGDGAGPRIAVLHATAGTGHQSAARALAAAIVQQSPDAVV